MGGAQDYTAIIGEFEVKETTHTVTIPNIFLSEIDSVILYATNTNIVWTHDVKMLSFTKLYTMAWNFSDGFKADTDFHEPVLKDNALTISLITTDGKYIYSIGGYGLGFSTASPYRYIVVGKN